MEEEQQQQPGAPEGAAARTRRLAQEAKRYLVLMPRVRPPTFEQHENGKMVLREAKAKSGMGLVELLPAA